MLGQIDSHTNFVFMNTGLPSSQVIEHFERNNIVLGPTVPQMGKYVRVAISTEENMKEFWRIWNLQPPIRTKWLLPGILRRKIERKAFRSDYQILHNIFTN